MSSLIDAMPAGVPALSTTLSWHDTLKRWSLRWGVGRGSSIVAPGLYRIGDPSPSSAVLVTCNYRMTVDLVRRDLAGNNCWLLVLDTFGVNVWCAAGKGTFGTDELVRRIFAVHLAERCGTGVASSHPAAGRGACRGARLLDSRLGDQDRSLTCRDCAISKMP